MKSFVFLFVCALSVGSLVARPLELHPLFSDHAVLQQQLPVPVWGWADPGEEVTVRFEGQTKKATTDEAGNWIVVLDELTANATPQAMMVSASDEKLVVNEVLIGEVWIGSGQSNMAWNVGNTFTADETREAVEAGEFDGIRLFKVPVRGTDERETSVEATWVEPTPDFVSGFSATAFYFASRLAADRSVPVGMIQSANGGTNAFSWINRETVDDDAAAAEVRTGWAAIVKSHPAAMAKYEKSLEKWAAKKAAAKASGETFTTRAPREPLGPDHEKRPAGHYNAMIAPLQPFAMRGVIWYQGEANSRNPYNVGYRDLMFALTEDWRADWETAARGTLDRREFPFYLVQLPNFAGGHPEGWPLIREQMLKFWEEGENTGMVVTIDTGDANDIHPQNKKPVGERLARFARGATYGEDIVYSGPIFDALQIEGEKAIVSFKHVGSGLQSFDGESLRHFQIAGADGVFVDAEAEIEGDTVVVASDAVDEPRAVRYAWNNNPEGINFGNKEELPASPFRTDSW